MDLDQTTMIGSALDLDSLEGDSKQNNAAQVSLIYHIFFTLFEKTVYCFFFCVVNLSLSQPFCMLF